MVFTILASLKSNQLLQNESIKFELDVNKEGVPFIKNGYWLLKNELIFTGNFKTNLVNTLLSNNQVLNKTVPKWENGESETATYCMYSIVYHSITFKWCFSLSKKHAILTTWLEMTNNGLSQSINWFPIFNNEFVFSERSKTNLIYYDALEYTSHRKTLLEGTQIALHSTLYSSDAGGNLPSWKLVNNNCLWFDIAWSGGWLAEFSQKTQETHLAIKLPTDETQLLIKNGENIVGPKLSITFIPDSLEKTTRKLYFKEKQEYADQMYKMPAPSFPLIYNHWSAVYRKLSSNYIINHTKFVKEYGFDVFVVDDGWFNNMDDWKPNDMLFKPGEFENALSFVKNNNVSVGIWSAPWLVTGGQSINKSEIDTPGYFNQWMGAHSLDLYGIDFNTKMFNHINYITNDLHANWWKYDQEFLGAQSRNGKMKNVIAFQNALENVRKKFPNLTFENCLSGGRMINDFTNSIAQIHWIRDGESTGLEHARTNVKEVLGAIQFLPPSKSERWTNRVNEVTDNEVLRYYCRSAMIGVWGISTDLTLVNSSQKAVLLSEIEHYRELNKIKSANNYQINYPDSTSSIASITYYDNTGAKAYIIVFRWNNNNEINSSIKLPYLSKNTKYQIVNLNSNSKSNSNGKNLINNGLSIKLNTNELSAIYKIESE